MKKIDRRYVNVDGFHYIATVEEKSLKDGSVLK